MTNFFLHLQFKWFKYSLISLDLSHSYSQLLGFQVNPLSNAHYQSIFNILTWIYLHSNVVYYYKHLHLINWGLCIWIINVIETTTTFTYFNTVRIKWRFINVNINNLWSYFTLLITHWSTFDKLQPKNIITETNICFTNPNILYYPTFFH